MRVIKLRNVSEAWARLPEVLRDAETQDSRAGRVLVCPEPVTTVYTHPTERVLLDGRRDCNPFFHLVEALWMLAGRNDAATLNHYVRDFGERFGEGDGTIHGAYGHRWRHALGFDQLTANVEKLRASPQDRQAVLQMWDGSLPHDAPYFDRGQTGWGDLEGNWRDRPCNTHAYFRVVQRPELRVPSGSLSVTDHVTPASAQLNMTVLCRSNDMVFGGYGANAVHFSVLQEYMAARIGVAVGTYTQVSNNFHVYTDVWESKRPTPDDHWSTGRPFRQVACFPMFDVPNKIDSDLRNFFAWHENLWKNGVVEFPIYHNQWFKRTAEPLVYAWHAHKLKAREPALLKAGQIDCPAWRRAAIEWLERRK